MRRCIHSAALWTLLFFSEVPARSQVPAGNPFPVGANVEVKSSAVWYPAKVKEVRGPDRWFISYDGYGSNWDHEVGPDRIRARGAANPVSPGAGGNTAERRGTQTTGQRVFPVGSQVEVLSSGKWYAAKVKEVRANDRWFIGYEGWGPSWDEEVGRDRIRAKGPAGNASSNNIPGKKEERMLAWPARPGQGGTAIEGAYLQVVMYSYPYVSYSNVAWFFTRNGRFSQGPIGGVNLQELSTKPKPGQYEGTYAVQGDKLILAWADGREPWVRPGYKDIQLLPIGAGATRQSPFPRGWRFDGSYEGGASVGGGALSSTNTLNFRRDGTYTRGSVVSVSSTGRTTEVSGGATAAATGTYHFDEYTLTLRENGTEKKYTVFAYGGRDASGRPEQIFWESDLVKRLNK